MDRKDFLLSLGISAGSVLFTTCLGGCSKSSDDNTSTPPPGGSQVDFTFDVTTDTNLVNNGWTIRNGAIIARNGTAYLAYESVCPHQGFNLTFNAANNTFPCSQTGPSHGSVFNNEGRRIAGPAARDLRKFNTQLNGNNLRVFA